ncbi:hypothetical protein GCM10028868_34190 [Virgibacillus kimchii]
MKRKRTFRTKGLILTSWDEVKYIELDVFNAMKYLFVIVGKKCFGMGRRGNLGLSITWLLGL